MYDEFDGVFPSQLNVGGGWIIRSLMAPSILNPIKIQPQIHISSPCAEGYIDLADDNNIELKIV